MSGTKGWSRTDIAELDKKRGSNVLSDQVFNEKNFGDTNHAKKEIVQPDAGKRAKVESTHNSCQILIRPLSVNEAWQGRRFKTKEYKYYQKTILLLLPNMVLPATPLKVTYQFGFSNKASDIDNPVKLFTDILQKKYGFDDKDIYEMNITKKITSKGCEYIYFKIESIQEV